MAPTKSQNMLALRLVQILNTTTKDSPLTVKELSERLAQMDILCSDKTIRQSIKKLEKEFNIKSTYRSHDKAYYTEKWGLSPRDYLEAAFAVKNAPFFPVLKRFKLGYKLEKACSQLTEEKNPDKFGELLDRYAYMKSIYTSDAIYAKVEMLIKAITEKNKCLFHTLNGTKSKKM